MSRDDLHFALTVICCALLVVLLVNTQRCVLPAVPGDLARERRIVDEYRERLQRCADDLGASRPADAPAQPRRRASGDRSGRDCPQP